MNNLIYNADGSLSKFRTGCVAVMGLCMLAYGYVNYQPDSQAENLNTLPKETAQTEAPAPVAPEIIEEQTPDPFVQAKETAMGEFFESISYYSTCGALNRGYEGCRFSFSEAVTSLYNVDAEASDDGFILSLKLINPQQDRTCASISYSSSGELVAFDEQGNRTEQQCFLEVAHANAGVFTAPADEDAAKAN